MFIFVLTIFFRVGTENVVECEKPTIYYMATQNIGNLLKCNTLENKNECLKRLFVMDLISVSQILKAICA